MSYILLIIGLLLILFGAHIFTEASSSLAKRFNISEFIIGLTVVAIGTSMPELIVSLLASLRGSGEMAIGNVVGSNLFNSLSIIGITALVAPITLSSSNIRRDLPIVVAASALLLLMTVIAFHTGSMSIGRIDGIILFVLFVAFIIYTIRVSKSSSEQATEEVEPQAKQRPMWLVIILAALGLCGLVFGGNLFLESATTIAKALNISDAVIAITIMSAGTSFPELATCVVAAYKGKGDMALGNVVGSNISNILLVLGASASITPLSFGSIGIFDIAFLMLSSILLFITAFTFSRRKVDRYEGVIFVGLYVVYIWQLL